MEGSCQLVRSVVLANTPLPPTNYQLPTTNYNHDQQQQWQQQQQHEQQQQQQFCVHVVCSTFGVQLVVLLSFLSDACFMNLPGFLFFCTCPFGTKISPTADRNSSAGKSAKHARGSEQVALGNATGREVQGGSARDVARATPRRMRHAERARRTWDRDNDRYLDTDGKFRSPPKCIGDAPGESHGTTSNDAVGSGLEGGGGSQRSGDGRAGGRSHHQLERRDQSKEEGATQATASGKTAGCCEDCTHTCSHADDQETSGSGSGRKKQGQISRRTCSRLRIRNIRDVYC